MDYQHEIKLIDDAVQDLKDLRARRMLTREDLQVWGSLRHQRSECEALLAIAASLGPAA